MFSERRSLHTYLSDSLEQKMSISYCREDNLSGRTILLAEIIYQRDDNPNDSSDIQASHSASWAHVVGWAASNIVEPSKQSLSDLGWQPPFTRSLGKWWVVPWSRELLASSPIFLHSGAFATHSSQLLPPPLTVIWLPQEHQERGAKWLHTNSGLQGSTSTLTALITPKKKIV